QVLGVLADHDEVDVWVPGGNARERARGADGREQVELVPERDVHAAKARADRGGDRALERHSRAPDLIEDPIGERRPRALEGLRAGELDRPFELDAGRLEHAPRGLGHLRTDTVARNERHQVRHARTLPDGGRAPGLRTARTGSSASPLGWPW